jgi:uncharacterized protein (DUF427 family)
MKAIWRDTIIAQSDATVVVEGNHYFPKESIIRQYVKESGTSPTTCAWKGTAQYYDIVVDGATNVGAAWFYPSPKPEASQIKDHVAFWKGVEIQS